MRKILWVSGSLLGLGLLCVQARVSMGDSEKGKLPVSFEESFIKLAESVIPGVVNISTSIYQNNRGPYGNHDFFRHFYNDFPENRPKTREKRPMALGSGFIFDASGYILTNDHVIVNADEVLVHFSEESEKPIQATIIGRDPELDVAILKIIPKRPLKALMLGSSEAVKRGQWVAAVGNPLGMGHSITKGIISFKGRQLSGMTALASYLQTDAGINPGNSGGPLVNLAGEVVGINTVKLAAEGIGFAIPIDSIKSNLEQLKTKGVVERGYIGVIVAPLEPEVAEKLGVPKEMQATFVTHITPNDPADKAGMQPYDVILAVGDKKVSTQVELIQAVTAQPVGKPFFIKILRSGKEKTLKLIASKRRSLDEASMQQLKRNQARPNAPVEVGMALVDATPDLLKKLGLPQQAGVLVTAVEENGPAETAGLQKGCLILEVEQQAVETVDQFFKRVHQPKKYLLKVVRPDGSLSVIVLAAEGVKKR